MKNFLFVFTFTVIGSILFYLVGSRCGNTTGLVIANGVLFLLLVVYASLQLQRLTLRSVIGVSCGTTAFLATCAFVGTMVYNNSRGLGHLLTAAVSIGYYPSGADVPILPGLLIWGSSLITLTFVGLIAGNLLHRLSPSRNT
jgi:hypothetical protein